MERRATGAVIKRRSPQGTPSNVVVRSIAFTPATLAALEALAAEIAPLTSRKASVSSVVRALLRYAHELPDVAAKLGEIIEHEQSNEIVWGKPRRRP
jgi:hypothetical protein